ncbi:MAG: winged helix-turn-helix domain-containing protein, partial [Actinomycetota bacterium]
MSAPRADVALLFTDIEASVQQWTADAASMAASLEVHDRMMADEIESGGGTIFTKAGDSFAAAFDSVTDASSVAQRCQRRLNHVNWPGPHLKVRMGLHIGPVQQRDGDYFGPDVNLAARVADAGHGGQIVATTAVASALDAVASTTPLGSYLLKGWPDPVALHQLGAGQFAELRAERESATTVLRFDDFEIDRAARTLRSGGHPVDLQPQVFDVLLYLVAHHDRLVSREELLDEVWGDQFVGMSALTTRIKQARQALGDDGRTQRYIRNERGRGYQFLAEVEHPVAAPTPVRHPQPASRARPNASIVGRDDDLDAVEQLAATSALTTVVGPGGVGKTTLVEALTDRWQQTGRDSAMVRLDGVRSAEGLLPALTTALGLADAGDTPIDACADWLAATGQTLILDNCEHLLEAVTEVVGAIHAAAPSTPILATSRQPLGVRAETIYRLAPLPVPQAAAVGVAADWPCLALFASAAQRAGGMSIETADDWAGVGELCRRLDGLPLAIELAASRLSTLGIRDLLGGLNDRLDWIRSRATDTDDRQRSLRSTVEWSFRFLQDDCVDLIAALALFPAGLRFPDLEALGTQLDVDAPIDELVARLVDASVVTCEIAHGEARYAMLETIRQYGLEHLQNRPELAAAAHRQLRTHAIAVAQAERDAWTGDIDPRERSLQRVHDELPNLRAARNLMLASGAAPEAIHVAVGLCAFTEEACLAELWSWHDVTVLDATVDVDSETAAGAELLEATAARNRGDIDACRRAASAAAEMSTDRWIVGRARHTAAMAALFSGEPLAAAELWLASDEQLGGCRGRLFAAMATAFAGDLDRAAAYLRECDIDDASAVPVDLFTNVHLVRGEVARVADTGEAREEFTQAVDVARRAGLLFSLGIAQVPLVTILEADGDTAAAAAGYRDLIELFLRSGTWTQVWTTLRNAARLLAVDDPATALLVCRAALDDPRAPALDATAKAECDTLIAATTAALGSDAAAQRSDGVADHDGRRGERRATFDLGSGITTERRGCRGDQR